MIFGPVEGRLGRKITPPCAHLPRDSKAPLSPRRGFSLPRAHRVAVNDRLKLWRLRCLVIQSSSTTYGASPAAANCAQASVAEGSVVLPPVTQGAPHVSPQQIISLRIVTAPATGIVLDAPPVLIASDHSVDYTCGRCSTILLHAEEDQVRGFLIRCTSCGTYNSMDF
jgi:DNA-directed RNA polymerase subunit RPC12/RpoP